MSELKNEVYKEVFETWRSEVDSYWQRNSYFAAFETVALAGVWYVVEHRHYWSGLFFPVLGVASTVIWLVTSVAVHRYISYWWESTQKVEHLLSLDEHELAFATKNPGSPSKTEHVGTYNTGVIHARLACHFCFCMSLLVRLCRMLKLQ